jgi:Xaa-Pro aminopeptidase
MDLSFIGKPHKYDARRVYSQTGADWQERVNFERMRKERLARAYSMKYPAEIKPNMYFAVETFAGHPLLEQTVRLETDLLITDKGHAIFTLFPYEEDSLR